VVVLLLAMAVAGGATTASALAATRPSAAHAAKTKHTTKTTHKSHPKAKPVHKTTSRKTDTGHRAAKTVRKVAHPAQAAVPAKRAVTPTPPPAPAPAPSQVAVPATCVNAGLVPTSADLAAVGTAVICLVNQQRVLAGLEPLAQNAALDAAAQGHSSDMVAENYFSHVAPTGGDLLGRVVSAGFATVDAILDLGENIAGEAGPQTTPAATVLAWMTDPEHRANILDPTYQQTGVGVVAELPAMLGMGTAGATYTETFGTAS
jgi:uncharacterized protein YkwD